VRVKMRFYRNFVSSAINLARAQREPNRLKNAAPLVTESVAEKADDGIQIKKLKLNDRELAQTVTMIRSKRKLKKEEQIIVEGNVLIREAIQAQIKLNKLIFSDQSRISDITQVIQSDKLQSIEFLKVPQTDLTFYSVLQTCPGVIGIFDKPREIEPKENCYPIDVIADQCREPNNCSIIRVANALPAKRLLLVKGNVDVWDTKSIRASSGSIFHFPTKSQLTWEDIDKLTGTDNLVLIADNNPRRYKAENTLEYDKIPDELVRDRPISVIIGGETHGISADAREFAKTRDWRCIKIPLDGTVNSLNISNALSIILFELRRKLNNL
jgi:tRNA G18 (ribose-2'-O)-methylase SpoU